MPAMGYKRSQCRRYATSGLGPLADIVGVMIEVGSLPIAVIAAAFVAKEFAD